MGGRARRGIYGRGAGVAGVARVRVMETVKVKVWVLEWVTCKGMAMEMMRVACCPEERASFLRGVISVEVRRLGCGLGAWMVGLCRGGGRAVTSLTVRMVEK